MREVAFTPQPEKEGDYRVITNGRAYMIQRLCKVYKLKWLFLAREEKLVWKNFSHVDSDNFPQFNHTWMSGAMYKRKDYAISRVAELKKLEDDVRVTDWKTCWKNGVTIIS